MKLINTPQGIAIQATGHLSDAILQAWTWRIFRKHARDLGGSPWRKYPRFATKEGAAMWVETVRAWFAIVHPGAEFAPVLNKTASGFANITQAILGDYGISILSPEGEDLGWTPVTYAQRTKTFWREGWTLQDGPYGLDDYFCCQAPDDIKPDDDMLRSDALDEWVGERVDAVLGEVFAALSEGTVSGKTSQGFGFSLLEQSAYPVKI